MQRKVEATGSRAIGSLQLSPTQWCIEIPQQVENDKTASATLAKSSFVSTPLRKSLLIDFLTQELDIFSMWHDVEVRVVGTNLLQLWVDILTLLWELLNNFLKNFGKLCEKKI